MRHVKTIGATAITAAGLIAAPAANAAAHTGRSTKSFPWRRFQFVFVAR
jgi:hypothetical protein